MAPAIETNTGIKATSQLLPTQRIRDKSASSFLKKLEFEQADAIMRQTDQYAQWNKICQNSGSEECNKTAQLILAHNSLLVSGQGSTTDSKKIQQISKQLVAKGIDVPQQAHQPQPLITSRISATTTPPLILPSSSDQSIFVEENLLILDLNCPVARSSETVIAYSDLRTTHFPLSEIVKILDFPIRVDAEKGSATGWFIDESRNFDLNSSNQTIQVNGQSIPWDNGKISIAEGEIFVEQELLSRLLPIDFKLSLGEMSAVIVPRERLPVEDQYSRETDRRDLSRINRRDLKYPLQEDSYNLISFPQMDLTLSSGVGPGQSDLYSRYSFITEGDIGLMGAEAYFSGNTNSWAKTARVALNKIDPQSELLGPLKATQISFGDVSTSDIAILGSSGKERGISISKGEINRSNDFDTAHFEGNVQSGWDVEIYRNGDLINSIKSGPDGRYNFEEIPVYYGSNSFKIIGYGPQGQQRILEEEEVAIGAQMLSPKTVNYSLSASQKDNSLLGLEKNNRSDESARLNASLDIGLTDRITGATGISSVEFNDTRHNYLQTGLRGSFNSWYGQADHILDSEGGNGLSFQAQTTLWDHNLKGKQENYFDFASDSDPNGRLQKRNTLSVNGRLLDIPIFSHLSYTLSNRYSTYSDYQIGDFNTGLASTLGSTNVSNSTTWRYLGSEDEELTGTFNVSSRLLGGNLRGSMRYSIGEENSIDEYRLGGNWTLSKNLSVGANVIKFNNSEQKDIYTSLNLNWDTGKVILSPSLIYDSEKGAGAFLGLTFSLGQNPVNNALRLQSEKITNKGSATAFVYHDQNNNQVFDGDDQPIQDARVRTGQTHKSAFTDSEGTAHFNSMRSYEPIDLELDTDSLQDPFWEPTVKGKAITPRPGVSQVVTFPVVTTGEIDGNLFYLNNYGTREVLPKIGLEIYNQEGELVQNTKSEYDGFYLFEKVVPGEYTVKIRKNDLFRLNLKEEKAQTITIGNDGTVSSHNDILLHQETNNDAAATMPQTINNVLHTAGTHTKINVDQQPSTIEKSPISIAPLTIQSGNNFLENSQKTSSISIGSLKIEQNRGNESYITNPKTSTDKLSIDPANLARTAAQAVAKSQISIRSLEVVEGEILKNSKDLNTRTTSNINVGHLEIRQERANTDNVSKSKILTDTSSSQISIRPLEVVEGATPKNSKDLNTRTTSNINVGPLKIEQERANANNVSKPKILADTSSADIVDSSKRSDPTMTRPQTYFTKSSSRHGTNQLRDSVAGSLNNHSTQNRQQEPNNRHAAAEKINHKSQITESFSPIDLPIQPFSPIGSILTHSQKTTQPNRVNSIQEAQGLDAIAMQRGNNNYPEQVVQSGNQIESKPIALNQVNIARTYALMQQQNR